MQETEVWSLVFEYPLEKGMATHSSILVWRIPWAEEPGRLWCMGLQRIRRDWVTNTFAFFRCSINIGIILFLCMSVYLKTIDSVRGRNYISDACFLHACLDLPEALNTCWVELTAASPDVEFQSSANFSIFISFWNFLFHFLLHIWGVHLDEKPSKMKKSTILSWYLRYMIVILFRVPFSPWATHSSILAWKIPWTEEPGRLQSMGLQRVGQDWEISLHFTFSLGKWVFIFNMCILKYFGHQMQRGNSFGKIPMPGKIEGKMRRGQ